MTIDLAVREAVKDALREALPQLLRELRGQLETPPASPFEESSLLTVTQVAARCGGATAETVRAWIHSKRLRATKPGRRYLVQPEDLDRFLLAESGRVLKAVDSPAQLDRVMNRIKRARSQ